jgi:hypothetical protein
MTLSLALAKSMFDVPPTLSSASRGRRKLCFVGAERDYVRLVTQLYPRFSVALLTTTGEAAENIASVLPHVGNDRARDACARVLSCAFVQCPGIAHTLPSMIYLFTTRCDRLPTLARNAARLFLISGDGIHDHEGALDAAGIANACAECRSRGQGGLVMIVCSQAQPPVVDNERIILARYLQGSILAAAQAATMITMELQTMLRGAMNRLDARISRFISSHDNHHALRLEIAAFGAALTYFGLEIPSLRERTRAVLGMIGDSVQMQRVMPRGPGEVLDDFRSASRGLCGGRPCSGLCLTYVRASAGIPMPVELLNFG